MSVQADLQWSEWRELGGPEGIPGRETGIALGSVLVNVFGHHQDDGGVAGPEYLLDLRGVEEPEGDVQILAKGAALVIADISRMHDCS
jgi:hypothetical protein